MRTKAWRAVTNLNYMPRWLYWLTLAAFLPLELTNIVVGNLNGAIASAAGGGFLLSMIAFRRWTIRHVGRDPDQI